MCEQDGVGCSAGIEAGVYVPETVSLHVRVNKGREWERGTNFVIM